MNGFAKWREQLKSELWKKKKYIFQFDQGHVEIEYLVEHKNK